MSENLTGLVKIIGISILLVVLWAFLAYQVPENFLKPNNIENLLRRTALFGILGIGVSFVIISSGIDLSIGSLVCFTACLLALFLSVSYNPYVSTDVLEIKAAEKKLVVRRDGNFVVGQSIRYYGGRRARNAMLTITAINPTEYQGRPAREILVDQALTRDDQTDASNRSVGKIAAMYPISEVSDNHLDLPFQQLGPRDRVWFVHPERGLKEKTVASVAPSVQSRDLTEVRFTEPLDGIDASYIAIPLARKQRMSVPLAIISVLLIALGLGMIHGILITKLKQQPFVVTLCGLLIYRGLSRWLSNDQTLGFGNEFEGSLGLLATGRLVLWDSGTSSFGIPYSFFFLVLLTIAAIIFLNFTIWGRYIMALGRNEEAARYSGVNTGRMTILAYVLCAVLAGFGGILFALDANSIAPSSFGNFFELYAIAAAVLGGCSLRGGEGSIIGVVVGTALMQTLYNSIVLLKIPDELEYAIIGAVILIGVTSDEVIRMIANRFKRD